MPRRRRRSGTKAPGWTTTAFGPYADFLVDAGLDGVLAFGTNGEAVLLSTDERRRGLERWLEAVDGRTLVAAHCGAQTTDDTVSLAAHAAEAGADAVAVIGPPYFKLDPAAQRAHLLAAAAACAPLPFYVYEFAATAGYAFDPSMLARLREEADNVVGMKVSDTPWDAFERYLIDGFDIFVGPEALIHRGRDAGAVGAVSALASAFPEEVAAVVRRPTEEGAEQLAALRARMDALPRHAALKRVVGWKGVPLRPDVRPPLRDLDAAEVAALEKWLSQEVGSARDVSASTRANAVLRAAILRAADDRHVKRFMSRYGMRLGAARFVAGETLDECVVVLRRLAEQGLHANTTLLGESVHDPAEATAVAEEYGRILERLHVEQLPVNVALKLTHLGLELDEELAYANVERVVQVAERLQSFVRIDMEQSSVVDATLRIYRRLREAGHDRVGTVLQSYLYRTESDLESLLPLQPNLRFVKGAYLEPPEIAYAAKQDVDAAYARLVEKALRGGAYAAIATHDESLIGRCIDDRGARGHPERTASSSRCCTACARGSSSISCGAGSRCWSRRPTGRSGTRT